MSQNSLTKFDQPLQIELRPSRQLGRVSLLIHLLAGIAWLPLALPVACKIAVLAIIAGHAGYFHRLQIAAKSRYSVSAISWDSARGWQVYNPVNGWQGAELRLPVLVNAHLLAARFRLSRFHFCNTIVVSDRLDADKFRRLRVRLLQSARGH
jgi:hypothetical protein